MSKNEYIKYLYKKQYEETKGKIYQKYNDLRNQKHAEMQPQIDKAYLPSYREAALNIGLDGAADDLQAYVCDPKYDKYNQVQPLLTINDLIYAIQLEVNLSSTPIFNLLHQVGQQCSDEFEDIKQVVALGQKLDAFDMPYFKSLINSHTKEAEFHAYINLDENRQLKQHFVAVIREYNRRLVKNSPFLSELVLTKHHWTHSHGHWLHGLENTKVEQLRRELSAFDHENQMAYSKEIAEINLDKFVASQEPDMDEADLEAAAIIAGMYL